MNKNCNIVMIGAEEAEVLCMKLTEDLPEYFGLPECNLHYAQGLKSRINFAATLNNNYTGLLSLDFPYPENANIYWMAVKREYHGTGIGKALIQAAVIYAQSMNAKTMTVETLSPQEADENYLKTWHFYEKAGFKPLLNVKPQNYEWNMVYMVKFLSKINVFTMKETIYKLELLLLEPGIRRSQA